jgi:hypothetical protein
VAGSLRARFEIMRDWRGVEVPHVERAAIDVMLAAETLGLRVDAAFHGDAPPPSPPGSTDRLWEHEVVELFVVGEGERYTEIELGPHGHHLVLRFAGVRRAIERQVPLEFHACVEGPRWRGHATLARTYLPEPIVAANAYAIHGVGKARRYLAAHPVPGTAPDFHRIDGFPPVAWTKNE